MKIRADHIQLGLQDTQWYACSQWGSMSNQFTPRHTNLISRLKAPDPEGNAEKLKRGWEQEVRRHGAKDQERQGEQWKNSNRDREKKSRRCNIGDLVHSLPLLFPLWVKSFPHPPWPPLLLRRGSLHAHAAAQLTPSPAQTHCHPQKNPPNIDPGCVLEQRGGLK